MPALFRAADQSSLSAQNFYRRTTAVVLYLLALAALGGAVHPHFGPGSTNWGGVVSAAAFVASLALQGLLAARRPERAWYASRALAESCKSLAWQFVAAGGNYPQDTPDPERALAEDMECLLHDLGDARPFEVGPGGAQITTPMRDLRRRPLEDRRDAYLRGRIDDQRDWYSRKARWNRRRARFWLFATLTLDIVGGIMAVLRATGSLDVDVLGIASALTAGIVAWMALKDHNGLEEAYSLASHELTLISASAGSPSDEGEWAEFVSDAEQAISREHRMWRAARSSRGA